MDHKPSASEVALEVDMEVAQMKKNGQFPIAVTARISIAMAAEIEEILIAEKTQTLRTTGRRSEASAGTIVRAALDHYLPLRALKQA